MIESNSTSVVTIVVNGHAQPLAEPVVLSQLLQDLAYTGDALAVEVNFELVPRSQHQSFQVKPGDTLEIVTLAGGG